MMDGIGIVPSIFETVRKSFPPGAEIVEIYTPEGVLFTEQQIKAIKWQEKHKMDIEAQTKVPDSLRALLVRSADELVKPKFIRQVQKCLHFGESFIAVANDGTVWHLIRKDEENIWIQLRDASVPALPQGESF